MASKLIRDKITGFGLQGLVQFFEEGCLNVLPIKDVTVLAFAPTDIADDCAQLSHRDNRSSDQAGPVDAACP